MSDRKSFKRNCLSNFIGLLLIGGMAGSLVMLGWSVWNLIVPGQGESPGEVSQLPTPTLRPTISQSNKSSNLPTLPPIIQLTSTPEQSTDNNQQSTNNEVPLDTGWVGVQAGMETRRIMIVEPETGRQLEQVTLVRLDPDQFRFDVGYSPGTPKTLERWQQESGAILAVNAGYFTADYQATGLTIAQGQTFGSSYGSFAGMVTINGDAPAPNLDVRWLRQAPYAPAENLWGAFQSFPILVHSGGTAAFPASSDNGDRSRRTAIGKDANGRVVILATSQGWFTLSELSSWLAQPDLGLQTAINLDGGTSTGLILEYPNQTLNILPFSPLPTVLLVYE